MTSKFRSGWVALLALASLAIAAAPALALNPPYDPLTLTCVSSTKTTVVIKVQAGATGAPAGFTLQWMTRTDWENNGNAWFSSDDPRLCKMSFSGQPSFTGNHPQLRWELDSNGFVEVSLGDHLFDETGVSGALADDGSGNYTNEACLLNCGTDYVFRAFAHASRFNSRSAFSFISGTTSPNLVEPGLSCATTACNDGCTHTIGFWKTHGFGSVKTGCVTGQNSDEWREDLWPGAPSAPHLTLGTVDYTPDQICRILKQPAASNCLIQLAHQLIGAKLNVLVFGAGCGSTVIAAADAAIGNKGVPPVGTGSMDCGEASRHVEALTAFNEGRLCASKCVPGELSPAKSQRIPWGQLKAHYR